MLFREDLCIEVSNYRYDLVSISKKDPTEQSKNQNIIVFSSE